MPELTLNCLLCMLAKKKIKIKEPFGHFVFYFSLPLANHIADNVGENFYGLPLYMHIILLPTYWHTYT